LAGTPVEASWCLSYKHDLVRALAEPNPMDLGLLLWHDGPLSAFYAPWDWVNTSAKIMLVGITPGAAQAAKGLREAQRCLREGLANEETLRRANAVGSFSGPMRANLVTMLDGIGLGGVLGIDSTARLFDTHPHLAAKTSAISCPVFVNGQNYGGGNPSLIRHPALRSLVRASLGPRVAMAAGALVIPLGTAAQDAVMLPTADGLLDRGRCLLGFPHPSGANGWRVRQYTARRETLREEVAHWAAMTISGPLRTVLADAPRQPTRAAPVIRHRLPAHSTRRSRRTEEAGMANSRASGGTRSIAISKPTCTLSWSAAHTAAQSQGNAAKAPRATPTVTETRCTRIGKASWTASWMRRLPGLPGPRRVLSAACSSTPQQRRNAEQSRRFC